MMVLLFIIISLSACNMKGNISIDGKGMIVDQLNGLKAPIKLSHTDDTIHKQQLTGDFRYDYLLK